MTRLTREEILRNTTCGDCLSCKEAPEHWTKVDFGRCEEHGEWVRLDETLWCSGCDSFEARPGFSPQPDYDWEDYSEWDD